MKTNKFSVKIFDVGVYQQFGRIFNTINLNADNNVFVYLFDVGVYQQFRRIFNTIHLNEDNNVFLCIYSTLGFSNIFVGYLIRYILIQIIMFSVYLFDVGVYQQFCRITYIFWCWGLPTVLSYPGLPARVRNTSCLWYENPRIASSTCWRLPIM